MMQSMTQAQPSTLSSRANNLGARTRGLVHMVSMISSVFGCPPQQERPIEKNMGTFTIPSVLSETLSDARVLLQSLENVANETGAERDEERKADSKQSTTENVLAVTIELNHTLCACGRVAEAVRQVLGYPAGLDQSVGSPLGQTIETRVDGCMAVVLELEQVIETIVGRVGNPAGGEVVTQNAPVRANSLR